MTAQDFNCTVTPFFIDGPSCRLFAVSFDPPTEIRGRILFCPPFAEEMNKSRRMVALTARRLAQIGYKVLLMDVSGTGDSFGEFVDARWETWIEDLDAGVKWLQQDNSGELDIWGLRLGACLALEVARKNRGPIAQAVLWQPVISGYIHMTQFLRLKLAAQLTGAGPKTSTGELRDIASSGMPVEVAGYTLAPQLIASIDSVDLRNIGPPEDMDICWFDVVANGRDALTVMSRKLGDDWLDAGVRLKIAAVPGEPFWTTQEISLAPDLIDKTVSCFAKSS